MSLIFDVLKAILRHRLKEELGEKALYLLGQELAEKQGQRSLGVWLRDPALAHEIDQAAKVADECFRENCINSKLAEWMVSLPLGGLPNLRKILEELPQHHDESKLENVIREIIRRDWKKLSEQEIDKAVDVYLSCLRQVLLPLQSQALSIIGRSVLRTEERLEFLHADVKTLLERLEYHRTLLSALPVRTTYYVSNPTFLSLDIQEGKKTDIGVLSASAWPNTPDLSQTYFKYVEAISSLSELKEYEHARELYWKTLYYSGYRELWKDRLFLSRHIVNLSTKVNDTINTGLVLSKGVAYAYMSQKMYKPAILTLGKAYKFFQNASYKEGIATCWSYMGDIYFENGRFNDAARAYDEAMRFCKGVQKYRIYLRKLSTEITNYELSSKDRISKLILLRDQYAFFRDYREALTDMEIAKSLFVLGATEEALVYSERSVYMLRDVIQMPRNAIQAERVLRSIKGRSTIT